MEKEINDSESRLFDLIESKDFSELNREEQTFVLNIISEEEYQFQRKIILDSSSLFEEEEEPRELTIPDAFQKSKKQITIPLYQMLMAIAAVVIFFIIIWPNQASKINYVKDDSEKGSQTINTTYIHDTIVKYVPEVQFVEKVIFDTVTEFITQTEFITPDNRLLEASNSIVLPELNKESIQTKGISLKDDQQFRLNLSVIDSY